jgi:SAM-dependent methyltransferase
MGNCLCCKKTKGVRNKIKVDNRLLPRKCLNRELYKLHLRGITLDIGSKRAPYSDICDELITLDMRHFEGVDVLGNAHNLPFKENSFDNIIMTSLLEHVQEPQKVVDEAYRIIKPNGLIVVYVPFMYPIHRDPHDYWRFTDEGLKFLLRNFEIVKAIKIGGFFSVFGTYPDFILNNLKLKFLLPILNIFIFLDDKFPGIFKNTACGFLVVAKKVK